MKHEIRNITQIDLDVSEFQMMMLLKIFTIEEYEIDELNIKIRAKQGKAGSDREDDKAISSIWRKSRKGGKGA